MRIAVLVAFLFLSACGSAGLPSSAGSTAVPKEAKVKPVAPADAESEGPDNVDALLLLLRAQNPDRSGNHSTDFELDIPDGWEREDDGEGVILRNAELSSVMILASVRTPELRVPTPEGAVRQQCVSIVKEAKRGGCIAARDTLMYSMHLVADSSGVRGYVIAKVLWDDPLEIGLVTMLGESAFSTTDDQGQVVMSESGKEAFEALVEAFITFSFADEQAAEGDEAIDA